MLTRKKKPGVTYQICIDDRWIPIDRCLENPERVWKSWLYDDDDVIGEGFFITADGAPWNDPGSVDTLLTAFSWIESLDELLASQTGEPVYVWAWEESNMYMWRKGPLLYMEDKLFLPKVCFDIQAFLEVFLPEAEKFYTLIKGFGPYAESFRPYAEALRAQAQQMPAVSSRVLYDQKVRAERPGSEAAEKEKYLAMREQYSKRERILFRADSLIRMIDEGLPHMEFPVDSLRALQDYQRGGLPGGSP